MGIVECRQSDRIERDGKWAKGYGDIGNTGRSEDMVEETEERGCKAVETTMEGIMADGGAKDEIKIVRRYRKGHCQEKEQVLGKEKENKEMGQTAEEWVF